MRNTLFLLMLIAIGTFLVSCGKKKQEASKPSGESKMEKITVTSSAFEQGQMIPSKYTCDGKDISPALFFEGIPEGTKSIAVISDDPDAPMGTWVHWVLYNLPSDTHQLTEAMPKDATLPSGAKQGLTDFGVPGYGGPCPPSGTHRYFFKVYALDTMIEIDGFADKKKLLDVMEGHIIGKGQLMGKYKRNR